MRLARWIFRLAGIYGILLLAPMYVLERQVAGPAGVLPHAENYYGFIGTALAAQVLFLIIARDPIRLRPAMLAGVLEKLAFGVPVWALWLQGRVAAPVVVFGTIDLVLAALFVLAYVRTPSGAPSPRAAEAG